MQKIYKTNRIVMCMSNFNNYNQIINDSLKNGKLKKTMIVASITDKYSTYKKLKENYNIPILYLDKSEISKDKYNEILKMKINQFNPKIVLSLGWENAFTKKNINPSYNVINVKLSIPEKYIDNGNELDNINNTLHFCKQKKINNIRVIVNNIHKDFIRDDIINYKDIQIYNNDNLEIFSKRLKEQEQECVLHVLQKFEKLL